MPIKLKETGAKELSARIKSVIRGLGDDKRGLAQFCILVSVRAVRQNFDREKDSAGKTWKRVKDRPGGKPLQNRMGRIPKGITGVPSGKGFVIGAGTATKAFNAVHNFGSKKWYRTDGLKGIPQRQFMYLNRTGRDDVVREIRAFVRRRIGK